MKLFPLLIFLSVSLKSCFNLELFSSGAALLGMGVSMGAYYLKCKQYECCTTDWIEFNESSKVKFFLFIYFNTINDSDLSHTQII